MLLELLAASMITPDVSVLSEAKLRKDKIAEQKILNVKAQPNIEYKYVLPQANKTNFKDFNQVIYNYNDKAKDVVNDFKNRQEKQGQFLKWVTLPQDQLYMKLNTSHVDSIYEQAKTLAARRTEVARPLVVLGIGGSKHTAEFMLNMTGFDRKRYIYFYSDIDPVSYNNFMKQVNVGGVQNLNFLVVSKSGTTFETSDAFRRFENALITYYQNQGFDADTALMKAQMHFALCTDATPTDKNLRGKVGSKNGTDNGYLKELFIHDDVGGRYCMFDDPGIFVLAYAGVDKEITKRILNGAIKASEMNMNSKNINNNPAILGAIYNVFSRDNGFKIIQHQYFGKLFEGAGENWSKQLYLESLKDFDYVVGKAPDSMHYATEGHFSPQNRTKYNTIMTIMTPNISQNYSKYTSAIALTYSETTPVKIEILPIENNAIKPESIGEYIQTKHFETVYTGMLRRAVQNKSANIEKLPEILQPSVETYKNKFKPGSPYELNPGM
ncbi:MAG: hypothetical protein ACI37Z_09450 [Candidatus Gastranaerophilaceae bacterium]